MAMEPIAGNLPAMSKYRYVKSVFLTEDADPGATAKVEFRNGGSGGPVFLLLKFGAGQTHAYSFDRPLYFPDGVYVGVPDGVVAGGMDAD